MAAWQKERRLPSEVPSRVFISTKKHEDKRFSAARLPSNVSVPRGTPLPTSPPSRPQELWEVTLYEEHSHSSLLKNTSLDFQLPLSHLSPSLTCTLKVLAQGPPGEMAGSSPWRRQDGRKKICIFSQWEMLLSRSPNTVRSPIPRGVSAYGRSLPPVTMSPSRRVVYIVKTGPV